MKNQPYNIYNTAIVLVVVLLLSGNATSAETKQQHVHNMSHGVMGFDMSKTMHIFKMTEVGGMQSVVVKDAKETDQISLIRQHLEEISIKFQKGDYSEPVKLHGADMPGLKEIQAGAAHIKASYAELTTGGQITFETADIHLLTAVHRWFGAQLSEHGADAKAE
jgi:cellobiose phosphorylase